jgi:hypothetical protein
MAAIVHPKQSDAAMNTSAMIEASIGGSLTDEAAAGRCGCGSESEWQPALAPPGDLDRRQLCRSPSRHSGQPNSALFKSFRRSDPPSTPARGGEFHRGATSVSRGRLVRTRRCRRSPGSPVVPTG